MEEHIMKSINPMVKWVYENLSPDSVNQVLESVGYDQNENISGMCGLISLIEQNFFFDIMLSINSKYALFICSDGKQTLIKL